MQLDDSAQEIAATLIIRALNATFDQCRGEFYAAVLLSATHLANQFDISIVFRPGKGFERGNG